MSMERRVLGNLHARCGVGEKAELSEALPITIKSNSC